ncbi:uncharacterized protein RAG0_10499 [Rhynchosporium agropyri]|uniref:J domain-containing protein n=1 Tax=Rhynchosporium agropyri TaxID=914238 RepID=A0A1E1L032_9HELO|nr:uncharacterized protein RAG0_10499 [Rhynchosporium agropyri]
MARPLASPDFYAVLEVSPTAPIAVIKENYRRLALKFHPDKNRDESAAATEKFQELSRAWEVLGDLSSRTEYDIFRVRRGGNERWWETSFAGSAFRNGSSCSNWEYEQDEDEQELVERARRRREDIDRAASARFRRESRSSMVSEEEEAQARVADETLRKSRAAIWKAAASQEYRHRQQAWFEYRQRNMGALTEISETRRAVKKAEKELENQTSETESYVEKVFLDAIERSRTSGAEPGDHDHIVLEKLFHARRVYISRLTQGIERNKKKLDELTRDLKWEGLSYEAEEARFRREKVLEALEILGPRDLDTPLFCILDRKGLTINRWNVLARVQAAAVVSIPDPTEGPWHDSGDWKRVTGEHTCGRCDRKAFHIIVDCRPAMCPCCGMIACNSCYRDLKLLQEFDRWMMSEQGEMQESLFSLGFDSSAG